MGRPPRQVHRHGAARHALPGSASTTTPRPRFTRTRTGASAWSSTAVEACTGAARPTTRTGRDVTFVRRVKVATARRCGPNASAPTAVPISRWPTSPRPRRRRGAGRHAFLDHRPRRRRLHLRVSLPAARPSSASSSTAPTANASRTSRSVPPATSPWPGRESTPLRSSSPRGSRAATAPSGCLGSGYDSPQAGDYACVHLGRRRILAAPCTAAAPRSWASSPARDSLDGEVLRGRRPPVGRCLRRSGREQVRRLPRDPVRRAGPSRGSTALASAARRTAARRCWSSTSGSRSPRPRRNPPCSTARSRRPAGPRLISSSSTSAASVRLTRYWHMPPAGSSVESGSGRDPLHVEPDVHPRLGRWSDGGELLLAAKAHVALLGGDVERAQGAEGLMSSSWMGRNVALGPA